MNLVLDAINGIVAGAEQRMPQPKIVRERCATCGGVGLVAIGCGPLARLEPCATCASRGYVNREAP